MQSAIIFDHDSAEPVADWRERLGALADSSLLWIDVTEPCDDDATELEAALDLGHVSAQRLAGGSGGPYFEDRGSYIHVTALAPEPREDLEPTIVTTIECLIGKNWIVTAHDRPVPVLDDFSELASGSGAVGQLEGPVLFATLFEWVLDEYSRAFETVESQLEAFDVRAMGSSHVDADEGIRLLIAMRSDVGSLRRSLTTHRRALASLSHPELGALSNEESAERFSALLTQFENTLVAARDAREGVVGSFDVLLARTGQRTNDIMKILTLTSVMLLPGTAIAGIMGMNFKVGLFGYGNGFWIVIVSVGLIAVATLAAARFRHWL